MKVTLKPTPEKKPIRIPDLKVGALVTAVYKRTGNKVTGIVGVDVDGEKIFFPLVTEGAYDKPFDSWMLSKVNGDVTEFLPYSGKVVLSS